jgi:hypothetical protein
MFFAVMLPMLPPGDKIWQLISTHYGQIYLTKKHLINHIVLSISGNFKKIVDSKSVFILSLALTVAEIPVFF